MKRTILMFLFLAVAAAVLIAGCTQQQSVQSVQPAAQPTAQPGAVQADTIKTAASPLGTILVDAQGKTLYYFASDRPDGGTSACTGQCTATWPPFTASTIRVSSPLDPADFGTITRTDGTKQATYYGWPLYYFQSDAKTGDVNGDGILGLWFVIKPDESVLVAHTPELGTYLTDTSGKTLYFFTKDTVNSSCTGACIAKWPAFGPDYPVTAPSKLDITAFAALSRDDGAKQSSFMGRPLYYYSGDGMPGDTNGQGLNNVWFVANTSGIVPFTTPPSTTLPTASPTTVATTKDYSTSYGGY